MEKFEKFSRMQARFGKERYGDGRKMRRGKEKEEEDTEERFKNETVK